jgi:FMN phosphatase YigB (HAD superfamily)
VRSFDVVTFDCYGTLIDWESGIAEAFEKHRWRTAAALKAEAKRRAKATRSPGYMAYASMVGRRPH